MFYEIEIKGIRPLLMHNGTAGLDTRSPASLEISDIARKRGSNRTESDDARLRELECQRCLWLDEKGSPTIPEGALRSMIETAARKMKQGPQVREGLQISRVVEFRYDKHLGRTVEELGEKAQFTVAVVVNKARVLRTRAKFDSWECTFIVETDEELCDQGQLEAWLDIGGRRIGLGDWRPEKSGTFGRFETVGIKEV